MASTALFSFVIMPKPMIRARNTRFFRLLSRMKRKEKSRVRLINRIVSISLLTLPAMMIVAGWNTRKARAIYMPFPLTFRSFKIRQVTTMHRQE